MACGRESDGRQDAFQAMTGKKSGFFLGIEQIFAQRPHLCAVPEGLSASPLDRNMIRRLLSTP
jgi:hypothetical protein